MELFRLSIMVEVEVELLGLELVNMQLILRLVKKGIQSGSLQMGPECLKVLRQLMSRCCRQSLQSQQLPLVDGTSFVSNLYDTCESKPCVNNGQW